jgi:hypothetical protein
LKTTRLIILGLLITQALAFTACQAIKSRFARQTLPDLGAPIPKTVQMDLDPSITKAKADYLDNCGHLMSMYIGSAVEESLIQAAHQTFQHVGVVGGTTPASNPDVVIRLRMLEPRLKIQTDALYDRAPAELSLDVMAEFLDSSGQLIAERPLQVTRKERLQLELIQKRCDYVVDPFVQDTSTAVATQFMQEARVLFDPAAKSSGTSVPPASVPTGSAPRTLAAGLPDPAASPSALSFKATLLDENSNLILEGGERIRVRVDVVNTGPRAAQDIAVQLAGPPSLMAQFPATKLVLGTMEAGGSKSLEFIATLPPSLNMQQAEFQVSLTSAAGSNAPPAQTLLASTVSTGLRRDDVDHIPAVTAGFQRATDYLLSIGLSSYREQHVAARKYAALDAEMVATYFQSLGGLPKNNVRLLQDWSALRPDIEEALLDWLPSRITKESIVTVYFAGQAVVSMNGETFLIPYDGAVESPSRLYPLKDLETALGRLKAKQVLFIFDGTVLKNGAVGKGKPTSPKWVGQNESVIHLIATTGFGKSLESDSMRHGLYTYYFLRALRGEADLDRNGEVTVGEATAYIHRKVPTVARTDFKQEQQPQVLPASRSMDGSLNLILTKPPVIPATIHP